MDTIHDSRYRELIQHLRTIRKESGITQDALATRLKVGQPDVSKVEKCDRRLDIIELLDWLGALEYEPQRFFRDLGWFAIDLADDAATATIEKIPALPVPGGVEPFLDGVGIIQHLDWQGTPKRVHLSGITVEQYSAVEAKITEIFSALAAGIPIEMDGVSLKLKNRDAIYLALEIAINALPDLNPSDIYHHIVYRMFLRQTRNSQSWARSGGEAVELFIARHYTPLLERHDVRISVLFSPAKKRKALEEMGLIGRVGNSKLDIVLHGKHDGKWHIFGAVHSKASLAERVTDDEPASRAVMERGFVSYLWTLDCKSFPPPAGDLVNRGELSAQSDKRQYVETHGSFTACYSYNTRGLSSIPPTPSGKLIHVSSLKFGVDPFPGHVVAAWRAFSAEKFGA